MNDKENFTELKVSLYITDLFLQQRNWVYMIGYICFGLGLKHNEVHFLLSSSI